VILVEDETIVRLFPPLRAAWAPEGAQSEVAVSGSNARRVIFAAINICTGHRIVMRARHSRQGDFQEFLSELRRRYRDRPITMLVDHASCHDAQASRSLANDIHIKLLWLPIRTPELNSIDHLWREAKGRIVANRQYPTIDDAAEHIEEWIRSLTPKQALTKAGLLSKNCWLARFSQDLPAPT
jgi:transposase